MPYIYDAKAWKRLVATANAVTGNSAHSTYVDNRIGEGSSAFPADGSSNGMRLVFVAYEPPNNRWHILRAGAT